MSPLNCAASASAPLKVTVISWPLYSVLSDHVTFFSTTSPVISSALLSPADLHEPVSFFPSCAKVQTVSTGYPMMSPVTFQAPATEAGAGASCASAATAASASTNASVNSLFVMSFPLIEGFESDTSAARAPADPDTVRGVAAAVQSRRGRKGEGRARDGAAFNSQTEMLLNPSRPAAPSSTPPA